MEVVVTGIGVVSPIGIGREAFWNALCRGQSGVGLLQAYDTSELPVTLGAEVRDFDPKQYVMPRKQLKVMCRDAQFGVSASILACRDAGFAPGAIDPDRFGVVLGADRICMSLADSEPTYRASIVEGRFEFARFGAEGMAASFPLNFLKVLPNMIASHISIALDARGPNNTIHQAEVSGLLAVAEAASVIRRGMADAMLAGGASAQLSPFDCVRHSVMGYLSRRQDDPTAAVRPFDADRDGQVIGEGAAVLVLESRPHAEARGATILARLLGEASACDPPKEKGTGPICRNGPKGASHKLDLSPFLSAGQRNGDGLRRAMRLALDRANVCVEQLGHINAHGLSTRDDDIIEAQAIHDIAPNTPVTALKSYFGNTGAAGGTMEMAGSVLAMLADQVPPTLNYRSPDPQCPICVIHDAPLRLSNDVTLLLNRTAVGQAVSVVMGKP